VLRFVEGGLDDVSMSRSTFDWGITVPWDSSHVIYVWIDALLNYWTAVEGSEEYWPADVHLVGKDILRFHAVIWPAMLLAAGLPLPRKVFANGWLLVGGEKMSKTKLTGIPPQEITDHFGSDAYRYYFLRELAFGQDGSFSWESMSARYQSELADQLGNLASRLTSMVERYRDGILPAGTFDAGLAAGLAEATSVADAAIDRIDFQSALVAIMGFVRTVNGYVTERAPWQVAKDPDKAQELDDILYSTADSLRAMAVLLVSFMPKAMQLLWESLGAPGELSDARIVGVTTDHLPPGVKVHKGPILFPRLDG
jgi:methionyl-tRNA synthetase